MQTTTQRVADFVASVNAVDMPAEVVEKAKVTLLHDLGVALAGHRLAEPAYGVAKDLGRCSEGGARLLVDGTSVTAEHATLATGALIHARTQDDTQLGVLTHLGSTTLPALIALGEREGAEGRDFLVAMIAGYEAASAIAKEKAALSTARGFRATSIYGPFAAAAACSRLMSLSPEQTTSALGLAAAFGGGTNQTWVAGTQEWQYQVGMASRSGLVAALLAARNVRGAPDALDGVMGHYRSYAGDAEAATVSSELGSDWQTLAVTYKPFPICAINQVPVTLMSELVSRHGIEEKDVESISLSLSPVEAAYPGTDAQGPFTDVGGPLMSAPYCLAAAVRHGTVRLAHLHDFTDEALMRLVRRIHVEADPDVPANSCRIVVRTREDVFADEYFSTEETFNWDRSETEQRLTSIIDEMPFGKDRVRTFTQHCLSLDQHTIRDLVSTTMAG